ncbi:helix-turn-helix domain-containing protein [Altererythrobacter xixiisoli]|uniref:Helix-turn-helix domain-containing protein n=1 Tax=Croceibacterium xixiisoli TaxID=1476466 RepID=A0A6I4U0H1_9SPHN|nr:Crp/Fnr family transcriptional regulator [Croceibacterium xixiisoli]MXP00840.1 helix-turn-helix domain-containing protein [Croceibacterium xixiisoli]
MLMDRLLANRRDVDLTKQERCQLENAISDVRTLEPRQTVIEAGRHVDVSTLLLQGLMCRFIEDRKGLRQLVSIHVPGEFVDLHAYPMRALDHSVGTLTTVTVADVPHAALKEILDPQPDLARKLWFATLIDAAMHRAWLFRVGRLDAVGRVAHFLCEMNARLEAVGLSDGRRFALPLTQADIAEICGLTTVHTNRVLRQLREAGLCQMHASVVEISDPAGLSHRGDFNSDYLYLYPPEESLSRREPMLSNQH